MAFVMHLCPAVGLKLWPNVLIKRYSMCMQPRQRSPLAALSPMLLRKVFCGHVRRQICFVVLCIFNLLHARLPILSKHLGPNECRVVQRNARF